MTLREQFEKERLNIKLNIFLRKVAEKMVL